MSLGHWIGRLLGLENVKSVDQIDPAFAAPWASRSCSVSPSSSSVTA